MLSLYISLSIYHNQSKCLVYFEMKFYGLDLEIFPNSLIGWEIYD